MCLHLDKTGQLVVLLLPSVPAPGRHRQIALLRRDKDRKN